MVKMIPLSRPYFDADEIEEIRKVLESGWVSQGPKVKEFEALASKRIGGKHAICLSNCTVALHLALLAIGIKPNDEVLVADFTFPATGHSVIYCGAKPIFVDVRPDTYNINLDLLTDLITDRTKAVIPVHTFGQSANMPELMKLATENGLRVVEDAACAFGTTYQNKHCGTFADVGCFSFHARKGITTGEGGMVITDDDKHAEIIRHLSVFGMKAAWEREMEEEYNVPEFHDVGYNYKMPDITAAVGVAQMGKLDRIIKRKRELAKIWTDLLEDIPLITPPFEDKAGMHIYQSYVVKVAPKVNRNKLIIALKKRGVQSQIGTYASHIQPIYQSKQKCPTSLMLHNKGLALPFFYEITEQQIQEAHDALKSGLDDSI